MTPELTEDDGITCPRCNGTGVVEYYPSMDPACKAKEECCPDCDGRGYLIEEGKKA